MQHAVAFRDCTRTGTGTVPARTTLLRSGKMFRHRTMRSVFARYLAYNITILQMIDITVSSNVWSMLYVTSSNGKCTGAAFRPL